MDNLVIRNSKIKLLFTTNVYEWEEKDFLLKSPELTGKTSNNKLCYVFSKIDVFKENVQKKSKHEDINIKFRNLRPLKIDF